MINFLKLSKNPRVGIHNAKKICWDLLHMNRTVELRPTAYYDTISLRPNAGDWIAFEQIFRALSYGLLETLGPFETAIDAGANIGLASVFFTKRLGAPRIVGLEPEEQNFRQAIHNTQHFSNIEILKAALWPQKETLKLLNAESSGSLGFQVGKAQSKDDVQNSSKELIQGLTIPEIMESNGWKSLDLLKIDIEGAEKKLFSDPSYLQWIGMVRVLVIELHDWLVPECSRAFFQAILNLKNFDMSLSGENIIIVNNCPGEVI